MRSISKVFEDVWEAGKVISLESSWGEEENHFTVGCLPFFCYRYHPNFYYYFLSLISEIFLNSDGEKWDVTKWRNNLHLCYFEKSQSANELEENFCIPCYGCALNWNRVLSRRESRETEKSTNPKTCGNNTIGFLYYCFLTHFLGDLKSPSGLFLAN